MNLDHYHYYTNDNFLDYQFFSEGPNGRIKKVVRFSPRNANGITYFNLGFGDWNENKGKIDDLAVTNNLDREKVLATVAAIVLDFTTNFPDVLVYAKGSTPARTRLYQMGITAHLKQIESLLFIYGYTGNDWQLFQPKINYEAFLTRRK